MKSFFEMFLGNQLSEAAPVIVNPYAQLNRTHQEVVREYFAAALAVRQLIDSIRRRARAVDHEQVLARFDRAEKHYAGIGFLPVLPTCVSVYGPHGIGEFNADKLLASGIFTRRTHSAMPLFFAPGMVRHVDRLLKSSAAQTLTSRPAGISPFPRV
jgi:hypothetical protein